MMFYQLVPVQQEDPFAAALELEPEEGQIGEAPRQFRGGVTHLHHQDGLLRGGGYTTGVAQVVNYKFKLLNRDVVAYYR